MPSEYFNEGHTQKFIAIHTFDRCLCGKKLNNLIEHVQHSLTFNIESMKLKNKVDVVHVWKNAAHTPLFRISLNGLVISIIWYLSHHLNWHLLFSMSNILSAWWIEQAQGFAWWSPHVVLLRHALNQHLLLISSIICLSRWFEQTKGFALSRPNHTLYQLLWYFLWITSILASSWCLEQTKDFTHLRLNHGYLAHP